MVRPLVLDSQLINRLNLATILVPRRRRNRALLQRSHRYLQMERRCRIRRKRFRRLSHLMSRHSRRRNQLGHHNRPFRDNRRVAIVKSTPRKINSGVFLLSKGPYIRCPYPAINASDVISFLPTGFSLSIAKYPSDVAIQICLLEIKVVFLST